MEKQLRLKYPLLSIHENIENGRKENVIITIKLN